MLEAAAVGIAHINFLDVKVGPAIVMLHTNVSVVIGLYGKIAETVKYSSITGGQVTFLGYVTCFIVTGDHAILVRHVNYVGDKSCQELVVFYVKLLMLQAAMDQWWDM
jgi:hypothetical protein